MTGTCHLSYFEDRGQNYVGCCDKAKWGLPVLFEKDTIFFRFFLRLFENNSYICRQKDS